MAIENAVSLYLPTFWISQPEIRFVQVEAQFKLRGIAADDSKYFYVLAALDQETVTCLLDVIIQPPDDGKYENLKLRLIVTFKAGSRYDEMLSFVRFVRYRNFGTIVNVHRTTKRYETNGTVE